MTDVLEAIQQAVNEAADKVGPAVVGLGRGWGRGSGVVIAPGQVLTVAHVLRGDEVAVAFAGGDVRDGRVLGVDSDLDVAVISVDTGDASAVTTSLSTVVISPPVSFRSRTIRLAYAHGALSTELRSGPARPGPSSCTA